MKLQAGEESQVNCKYLASIQLKTNEWWFNLVWMLWCYIHNDHVSIIVTNKVKEHENCTKKQEPWTTNNDNEYGKV